MAHSVYVITVNWNGWEQTLTCLESLFRQRRPACRVVVCDNASTDGSLERIKAWADGDLDIKAPADFPRRDLMSSAVAKPIPYVEYHREEAESNSLATEPDTPLILIQTGANLGFAGGNNVGIRYVVNRADYDYIWLLNNDTIVSPDALSLLIRKLQLDASYGICGATVVYQDGADRIQTRGGGVHRRWLGQTRPIGFLEPACRPAREADIERLMTYVSGACMLVTRSFIQTVGLLNERYFLYFEELDWALRGKALGYKFAYAAQAIVYHKEGGTTGGGDRDRAAKSWLADYYEIRNRFVITKTFYPWALPIVALSLAVTLVNRIRRKKFDRLGMVFQAARDGCLLK